MVCELSHPTQSCRDARVRRLAAPILVTTIGLALLAAIRSTRVVVSGDSMLPGLRPGDRLLLMPVLRPQEGQLIAVRDPRQPGRVLVKRVHSIRGGLVEVRGDNVAASTDSRHFGPVRRSSVIGRPVYRYGPVGRAGRLPG